MTEVNTSKQEFEAAIATLSVYGFSKVLIKRTLKDILRVYNGNEGWPLIKENGYEVVIERLISDDGPKQRKSQRKDGMQTRGHGDRDKEEKTSGLDLAADDRGGLDNRFEAMVSTTKKKKTSGLDDRGGLDNRHPVVGGSSLPIASSLSGHPVADISRDSSLLEEPTSDVVNLDIHSHQRKTWTRNGSFPMPPWLEVLNVSKKGARQKIANLRALLESLDKASTKQAENLENYRIDSVEFKIVKDEKIEYIGERLKKGDTHSCEGKVVKDEEVEFMVKCPEERHVSAETHNTSIFAPQQESKSATQKLVDVPRTQRAEMCNMASQQASKPSILKTQKLVDVSHIQHAETCNTATWCLQQESNSEKLKSRKLAEATHVAETFNTSTLHSQQESNSEVRKAQESVDVPHTQHDSNQATLDPTGIKQRKGSTGQGLRKRKRVSQEFCEKTCEPVSAAQTKRPRTQSTTHRANNLQSTFEAAERLDIARMSAFKLTRRRDGGPNPMFSRLQKLKQAGAGASVSQNNNQESSLFHSSQCGEAPSDSLTEPMLSQRSQPSSDLPPGRWDPSATCTSPALNIPDITEETQDRTPAQESPKLPPGFEERTVSSPESPIQPPGFCKPCGRCMSQEPTLDGRDEDTRDTISSDGSPRLPPGFSELYDPFSSQESPTLPPGFWEPPDSPPTHHNPGFESCEERTSSRLSPDVPPGFWKSPDKAAGLSSPSAKCMVWKPTSFWVTGSPEVSAKAHQEAEECLRTHSKSKGTPPKQVFIANIPSDYEGAEQKLYSLVKEILGGFKSVPISATLPRKILVTQDHAFVEFCCEAMAGIFMDAYHANASVLRIDGEQLLAARSLHLMKMDVQLRHAIAERLRGEVLDPRHVFYLGNVPPEWQNEKKLLSHICTLLEGESNLTSKTFSVYTIPDFSDVYVHISSSLLAETFFLRCLSDKEHLEEISPSLFVCRNSTCLPRAAQVCLGS